jgi:tRNA dimethylallyltransferase
MEIARRVGGEILCVDSMTVYRGMDIGTAKPTLQEQAEVRHHLLDLVEPTELFTVARFVEMADGVIAEAGGRNVPLVATGGTPLYYKALFEGLFDGPSADPELRQRLLAMGNEALYTRLREADPAAAARIHVNDTKRLVRALEVFELTGQPISAQQQEWSTGKLRHEAMFVGLMWEKEALNRRINTRVKAMMQAGWLEEVRGLLDRYGTLSRTAAEATGYAELIAQVQGRMKLDDAVEQIKIATRQLARKQMKWFRRFANTQWIAADRPMAELADEVMKATGW